jgi:hypothetical protein
LPEKEDKDPGPWKVDPKIFEARKSSLFERHVLGLIRAMGGYSLLGAAFAYPVILVYLGVAYGGLVFWGAFAGSFVLIAAPIRGLGLEKNFATKDISWTRSATIPISFILTLAFIFGLVYLLHRI